MADLFDTEQNMDHEPNFEPINDDEIQVEAHGGTNVNDQNRSKNASGENFFGEFNHNNFSQSKGSQFNAGNDFATSGNAFTNGFGAQDQDPIVTFF